MTEEETIPRMFRCREEGCSGEIVLTKEKNFVCNKCGLRYKIVGIDE